MKIKSIKQAEEEIYPALSKFYKDFIQGNIEKHGWTGLSQKCGMNKSQFHFAMKSDSLERTRRIANTIEEANQSQGEDNDNNSRIPLGRPRNKK
ncbi:hypothetical protein [Leptospira phage LE4]|uniref:Uncharacterized protein n=1 Tax=Leptospira phage LE4 TaxID=2041383 RepID=A0A343LEG2_9CAUD|nr:hypothetical protein HWB34_gp59 [Leptospira phage LE4]ATN95072.1 hypothetical protein [Leptospira phage LE4]